MTDIEEERERQRGRDSKTYRKTNKFENQIILDGRKSCKLYAVPNKRTKPPDSSFKKNKKKTDPIPTKSSVPDLT